MKVVYTVGGLGNSSGTTPIILNLARCLADTGHKVVVCYVSGRVEDALLPAHSGVEYRACPLSWSKTWAYSREMGRTVREQVWDAGVLHAFSLWYYPTFVAWRAAIRRGTLLAVSPQGALDEWTRAHHEIRKTVYGTFIEKRLLRTADAVVACTEAESRDIRRFGCGSYAPVVPNGVNAEEWENLPDRDAARRDLGISNGLPVALFLGRLNRKKGLEVLLDSVAHAAGRGSRMNLVVAGSDGGTGYREQLECRDRDAELQDSVTFIGEVRAEQKRRAFAAADFFVLPSLSEGMPVAVLEAMAAGLPVIISRQCHLPSVATRGAGLVVNAEKVDLATALAAMAGDPVMRRGMASEARRLAREEFDWRVVSRRMLAVYESLLTRRDMDIGKEVDHAVSH